MIYYLIKPFSDIFNYLYRLTSISRYYFGYMSSKCKVKRYIHTYYFQIYLIILLFSLHIIERIIEKLKES